MTKAVYARGICGQAAHHRRDAREQCFVAEFAAALALFEPPGGSGASRSGQVSDPGGALVMVRKRSSGSGNTTVVFFSTPISVSVCR